MYNFIMIVLEQSFIYLPLALGAYISFSLLKVPDLSLESAYLMGGLAGTTALSYLAGYPLGVTFVLTILAAMCGGALVGLCSSCMTSFGKIPHLLSAIMTFGLFHGIFQFCSPAYQSLAAYDNGFMLFPYVALYPELCALGMVGIIMILLISYLLTTQLGYSFAIFGHNPKFFKHFGIATSYVFITGMMISNGLAGLAGFLFAQTSNLIELNMGIGKSLFCITALILGRSSIPSKKSSIMIPVIGVITYFALQQMLLKIGFNLKYFTMMQSLLVLVILLMTSTKNNDHHDQLGV